MKQFTFRSAFSLLLTAVLMVSLLTGCGSTPEEPSSGKMRVAIVQQLDQPSLDEIRTAIEQQLTAGAAERGLQVEYKVFNGQNDPSTLGQIGAQVVSDGYDAVIPIATLAAQSIVTAAEGSGIPVIFSAISYPETAGLSGLEKVTGTSDALDTAFILDMMLAVQPEVKTVGLLYSNSEVNSQVPIRDAKACLEEQGIAYLEKTGNTADEISAAVSSMIGRVDAVFTPTDNVVMSAESAVAEALTEAGIPHYAGADSFVASGAFAACGVNYTRLGRETAELALDILAGGAVPPCRTLPGDIITVNPETAAALSLDYSVFSDMAKTVTEMTAASAE